MPDPCTIAPLLLDTPAAARCLSISVRTLHRLVASGALRPIRIGRLSRYPLRSLQDFANACPQGPQPVGPVGATT